MVGAVAAREVSRFAHIAARCSPGCVDNIASKHHSIRLIDRLMNRDRKTRPRMKAVEQFAKPGPVGILKLRCTTRSERTYRCRRTRRFGVMCAEQGACVRRRSWAGYTIDCSSLSFNKDTRRPNGNAKVDLAHPSPPRRYLSSPRGHRIGWGR
jgi:hypothetical protein